MELDIKTLGEKLDVVGEAVVAAQKANDEKHEATAAAATKAATEAMEAIQKHEQTVKANEEALKQIQAQLSRVGGGKPEVEEAAEKYADEFAQYCKSFEPVSSEASEGFARAFCDEAGIKGEAALNEIKTLIAGNNPQGGYFLRPQRSAFVSKRLFETSPMRSLARVETLNSDVLEIIIDDDEASSGGWVGETDSRSNSDTPDVGKLSIPLHEQYAMPLITQKMLNLASFDVEGWLTGKIADILGRTENTAYVAGDGSQKPKGILSYSAWASAGVYERDKLEQINSGGATALTANGLKELQNALKEFYQARATFVMKRDTFGDVITLKDGQGRYMLDTESLKNGDTKILLGKPVVFMDDMQAVGANALAIAYGDFSLGYTIADGVGIRVLRDPYTTKGFVKFYATKYTGGAVSNYEAIKIQKVAS